MKTCPKCERVYDDQSLNFCLDDGEWLSEPGNEAGPDTKILPGDEPESEAPTRHRIPNPEKTAILPTGSLPEEMRSRKPGRRSVLLLVGAAGIVIVAAVVFGSYQFYIGYNAAESSEVPDIRTERLTGEGKTREAAISPDGNFLAYLQVENERQSLWIRQMETDSTIEILDEGAFKAITNVIFSPDGNFVFFGGIESDNEASVFKVPTLGGTPLRVPVKSMTFSLSPDGKRIAYYGDDPTTSETWLATSSLDGSDARKVVSRTGKKFLWPQTSWSPDGEYLLFTEGDDDAPPGPYMSLSIYSFSENSVRQVVSRGWGDMDQKGLAWDSKGRFIYVMASETSAGVRQLWRVSFPDGEVSRLTNNQRDYFGISITQDGRSIVSIERESRSGIWVSGDLDPNNVVEVFPPRGDTWSLDWTPDGRIVYVSDQSGATEVWVMNPDGTDQRRITNDRVAKALPSVSPGGDSIVYFSPDMGFQIFTVPLKGGDPTKLPVELVGPEDPSYSSDGKWIIFSAWTEGKNRIYRMPGSGGKSERLTEYTAFEPRFSPDGSTIACFIIPDGKSRILLAIIPAEGGPPIKTFEIPITVGARRGPVWTPDGKAITYIDYVGERSDLWAQPIDGGDQVRLTNFGRPWLLRRAYSRDGKRIALTRGETFWNAVLLKGIK